MINSFQSISFTGKNNLDANIKKVRKVFDSSFPDLKSPSRIKIFSDKDNNVVDYQELADICDKLLFVRKYKEKLYPDGGVVEYFRGLIGIVKAFGVANCDEYAEILKTILRLNGLKKVDIFEIYASDFSKKDVPRRLDHVVTAVGVSHRKNQKQSGKMFVPSNFTKIIDFWLDDKIRTYKEAKKCYKILGLKESETLLLKPVKSYEPNKDAFDVILKDFPELKINRHRQKK